MPVGSAIQERVGSTLYTNTQLDITTISAKYAECVYGLFKDPQCNSDDYVSYTQCAGRQSANVSICSMAAPSMTSVLH